MAVMASPEDELAKRARFLRNAAPQQFEDFRTAFIAYYSRQIEVLVFATDNLPLAQGHAQQCRKLAQILDEARNG
jgi:hypothetical protein